MKEIKFIRECQRSNDFSRTYLSGRDQDSNLLTSLGELIRLDRAVVVEIEVLEVLEQNSFFVLVAACFLSKLSLDALLEAAYTNSLVRLIFNKGFRQGSGYQRCLDNDS